MQNSNNEFIILLYYLKLTHRHANLLIEALKTIDKNKINKMPLQRIINSKSLYKGCS